MSKIEDEYQDGGREEEEEVELPCQISPVFIKDGEISNSEYELTFLGKFSKTLNLFALLFILYLI